MTKKQCNKAQCSGNGFSPSPSGPFDPCWEKWVHRPFAGRPYLKWVWAKNPYIHLSFSISISKCSHYHTPFAAALCWQNSLLLTWSWRKATGLFAWINSRLQPELELWLQKCCIAGLIYLLQNTAHKKNLEVEILFHLTCTHSSFYGLCWPVLKTAWTCTEAMQLKTAREHKQII